MTKEELREKANDLPLAPGVYLMMDKTGRVIYVGKAKKLKNRVSQYFQDSASHTAKTRNMVSQVDRFDTIFVTSEFEALVLENSLIKRHMPRYNILLKDDKGYPFVRLSKEAYPRFSLVNKMANDSARYFGPFGGRFETRQALDHGKRLMEILKQPLYNPMPVWKQAVILYVATSGLLSNVALEKVNEFVQGFVDSLQANQPGLIEEIQSTGTLPGTVAEQIRTAMEAYQKQVNG